MTNTEKALAEIQRPAKRDRLRFILALAAIIALALSILLGWFDTVKPSAATLDNGGFCIPAHYDSDPEIKGMAGNCSHTPTQEEHNEVAYSIHSTYGHSTGFQTATFYALQEAAPGTDPEDNPVELPAGYALNFTATHEAGGEIALGRGSRVNIDIAEAGFTKPGGYSVTYTMTYKGEVVFVPAHPIARMELAPFVGGQLMIQSIT
ncbi:MAG: hypothetical protein K0R99_925 [Microbacterium sp.]|jgi:hypothetical protein|uniref:hypothetical protein n=1 Tax=Microbacterium sp. TaxID=51671 RepID=UPI002618B70C|nr:hypothetical protein [Microbacterium sp.]MDF2559479.1 hypothetical protein [Microbacterium sp.]